MNCTFKAAATALMICVAGSADAGSFEDATAAFEHRDYIAAMQFLRPLADQGDASAHFA